MMIGIMYGLRDSLFCRQKDTEINGDVYKFNGVGMIMWNPIDYLLSKMLIRKYIKKKKQYLKLERVGL